MQRTEFVQKLGSFIHMIEPTVKKPQNHPEPSRQRRPLQNVVRDYSYYLVQTFYANKPLYERSEIQRERDLQYYLSQIILAINQDQDDRYRDVMAIEVDEHNSVLENAVMVPKAQTHFVGKTLYLHQVRHLWGATS